MFKYTNILFVFPIVFFVSISHANDCEDKFSRVFEKQDDMHRFLKTYKEDAYTDGHDSRVFKETAIETYQLISALIVDMKTVCNGNITQVFPSGLKKKIIDRIEKDYVDFQTEYEEAKENVPNVKSKEWIESLVTRLINVTKLLLDDFQRYLGSSA